MPITFSFSLVKDAARQTSVISRSLCLHGRQSLPLSAQFVIQISGFRSIRRQHGANETTMTEINGKRKASCHSTGCDTSIGRSVQSSRLGKNFLFFPTHEASDPQISACVLHQRVVENLTELNGNIGSTRMQKMSFRAHCLDGI